MREFAGKISRRARAAQDRSTRPAMQTGRARPAGAYLDTLRRAGRLLETIRASLEENRVDLYLQPIVSLPQRKLRFYEALSRLRAEDGSVIMPAQYMKVAAPAGLMSVVDNLLLFRCVQIVRRLTQKSRDIGVFCNISGDTLADHGILPAVPGIHAATTAIWPSQIVFEFAQDAVLQGRGRRAKPICATCPASASRCRWIMSNRWRWISPS